MADALISHSFGENIKDAIVDENFDIIVNGSTEIDPGKKDQGVYYLWNYEPNDEDYIVRAGTKVTVGMSNSTIVQEYGITSDKIVEGNTIFGVEGSANIIPNGNIVFTPVTHMSMIILDGTHTSVSDTLVLNKTISSLNVRYNTIYNIQLAGIYSQSGDSEWYGAYETVTSSIPKGETIDFSPLDSNFSIEQSFVFSAPNGYFDSVDITANNFRINDNGELLVDIEITYGQQIETTYYGIYLLFYAIADRR